MSTLKILILGTNGFFGKSIKNLLKKDNYDFIYLERKDVDILDKINLHKKFQEIKPDIVIHCCGIIGSSESNKKKDQFMIFNNNIELNINILECCSTHLVKKVILFSTYRIFSPNIQEFYNEDDLSLIDVKIDQHNTGYLLSKKIMNIQIEVLKKYNPSMKVVCLVFPNIFGCYDHFIKDGRIVPSLITKLKEQEEGPIYIHSHPQTEVNLIYINDIVKIIDKCIQSIEVEGNIIIFDNKTIITLEDLVSKIKEIMKLSTTVFFEDNVFYEKTNIMKPNINKFNSLFSDFIFSNLDDSLKECIDFYLSNN